MVYHWSMASQQSQQVPFKRQQRQLRARYFNRSGRKKKMNRKNKKWRKMSKLKWQRSEIILNAMKKDSISNNVNHSKVGSIFLCHPGDDDLMKMRTRRRTIVFLAKPRKLLVRIAYYAACGRLEEMDTGSQDLVASVPLVKTRQQAESASK